MYKIMTTLAAGLTLTLLTVASLAAEQMRDPTAPLGHQATAGVINKVHTFHLNSVLIGPRRKLAIINGHTLREGEIIPGSSEVQVKHILTQRVILQQAGKKWELNLSPTTIRKH